MSDSVWPHRWQPTRLRHPWDSPGKNTGVGCHFLLQSKCLQTISAGEGVEKREHSCTVGGNVNWYSHYGRWYGDSLKKLGIKPPYDPAIPLLGIYPKETKIEKTTCIPLFIAALFTIARTWKQCSCPLTDEWIKLWYIYTMEYYSAIKRNTFESVLMR